MPATGAFRGMPASIIASEAPQTLAMDEEPFELGDLGDDADRVGEASALGQHRMHRAPGELAVADLAAAGRAHAAHLAHRVGREVIVQQEGFLVGAFERVDPLLVLAGAERGHHQRLRLAAGEQRRAVRARDDVDLAIDGAHRTRSRPSMRLPVLRMLERTTFFSISLKASASFTLSPTRRFGGEQFGHGLRLRLADLVIAVLLAGDLERLLEVALDELLDLGLELVLVSGTSHGSFAAASARLMIASMTGL